MAPHTIVVYVMVVSPPPPPAKPGITPPNNTNETATTRLTTIVGLYPAVRLIFTSSYERDRADVPDSSSLSFSSVELLSDAMSDKNTHGCT